MDLSKVTLNLFDVLGYLLPGYIVLLGFSVIEASAAGTGVLSLNSLRENVITFSIIAYFMGHTAHYTAITLQKIDQFLRSKNIRFRVFDKRSMKLKDELNIYIKSEVAKFFAVRTGQEETLLSNLDLYQLTDSYLAVQKVVERDSLLVREGFAKTSMGAFFILTVQLLITLFYDGVAVQLEPERRLVFNAITSGSTIGCSLLLSMVFWRRFVFFKRFKTDRTKFLFLSLTRDQRVD